MDEQYFREVLLGKRNGIGARTLRIAVIPASLVYSTIVRLRNIAFDRAWLKQTAPLLPVLSIGNLTVGGTGKTPMVEYFAKALRDRNKRVAILSRGYGASDGPNDEALVLEQNLPDVPHLQDKDRVRLVQIAKDELESEVILLDDGFQHRRLGRTRDIVLIDALNPFGGGRVLPAGLLREPLAGLRRAQFAILTRVDAVSSETRRAILDRVSSIAPDILCGEVRFAPTCVQDASGNQTPIEQLRSETVLGFCGIGNPESFRHSLDKLCGQVADFKIFGDHHGYSREDVSLLSTWVAQTKPDRVLTTQKDLVKLQTDQLAGIPLGAIKIEAVWESGSEHADALLTQLTGDGN